MKNIKIKFLFIVALLFLLVSHNVHALSYIAPTMSDTTVVPKTNSTKKSPVVPNIWKTLGSNLYSIGGSVSVGTKTPIGKFTIYSEKTFAPAFVVSTENNPSALVVDSNGDTTIGGRLMLPMGQLDYFDATGTTVNITGASDGTSNLVKVNVPTKIAGSMDFDNGGVDNGRLRYIGTKAKVMHTALTISMAGKGSGVNSYVFALVKNGVVSPESCRVIQSMSAVNDTQSTALHCMVSMQPNDYLELYVGDMTDSDSVVIKTMNLFAMGM